jgi:hypothetical protein
MQAIWKKKEKLSPLGNEASLNFVSLRSHFNSVGRRGLSRVEMNALRAPLTTLYVSAEMEIFFSLDTADAFIEADLNEAARTAADACACSGLTFEAAGVAWCAEEDSL